MIDEANGYDPEPTEEPTVLCRHFLFSHTVWHDPAKPSEFSLGRIIAQLQTPDGIYPWAFARLFSFGQLYGTPGEYGFGIRLVGIAQSGYDEEVEVPVDHNGRPMEWRPSRPLVISGLDFVDPFAVPMTEVWFPSPGVYEFQLLLDGIDEPVARERIQLRGDP